METQNITQEIRNTSLQEALEYLDRGWRPIPIHYRGKQPLLTWKDYQDRAPTREEVESWFTRWPNAGVALLTGSGSNLVAIDIDGPEGETALKQLIGDVETLTNVTAKGRHVLFSHPGSHIDNAVKLLPGIDVRGDGGYIIVSPSIHETGHHYHWADAGLEPAPLPQELLKCLTNEMKREDNPKSRQSACSPSSSFTP